MTKNNLLKILYKDKSTENTIKKSFLFGLIYFKKDKKTSKSEIRILGLPCLRKKFSKGRENFYFLGLIIFSLDSKRAMYKEIIKNIGNRYVNIYINFNCSGETYLYLSYLKPQNSSVFIATKKYHIDLCKMLHPNIDCIYLPNIIHLRGFDNAYKEDYMWYTFYNILPFNHFVRLEKNLRKGLDVHYCKEICKTMGVEYSPNAKFPTVSENAKNSALDKAKRIGLNLDNFVFLCPESQSNEDTDKDFWGNLVDDLYNKGYDVFLNALNQNPKYGTAKTCFLTFEEAYYIASLSKEIIGLRSGFIEYLTSIPDIPITCYYTDFKDRGLLKPLSAEQVLNGFTLKALPNTNIRHIKEVVIK